MLIQNWAISFALTPEGNKVRTIEVSFTLAGFLKVKRKMRLTFEGARGCIPSAIDYIPLNAKVTIYQISCDPPT